MGASDLTTTSISLPRATLALLRHVAAQRANEQGRRASVSGVIAELLRENEAALERSLHLNGRPRR